MPIGMESWFGNFSQISRLWNSPESLADIPRPYTEIALYGAFKGGEITSLIGGLLAHPLYRWYLTRRLTPENTTPNSHKIIRSSCRRLQGRFLLAGLAAGPMAALAYAHSITESELLNKCYAIRCDAAELTTDRCAVVAGFVGWYWKRFQGAVDGINIGLAYAMFNNKILAKYTSPLLKDSVQVNDRYDTVEAARDNRTRLIRFMAERDKKEEQLTNKS